jgi:hypothetical protein
LGSLTVEEFYCSCESCVTGSFPFVVDDSAAVIGVVVVIVVVGSGEILGYKNLSLYRFK